MSCQLLSNQCTETFELLPVFMNWNLTSIEGNVHLCGESRIPLDQRFSVLLIVGTESSTQPFDALRPLMHALSTQLNLNEPLILLNNHVHSSITRCSRPTHVVRGQANETLSFAS